MSGALSAALNLMSARWAALFFQILSAKRVALIVIQDECKKSAKNNLSNEQKNILEKKYILHYFLKGYQFFLKKESLSIVEIALINTVLYFFWERKMRAEGFCER